MRRRAKRGGTGSAPPIDRDVDARPSRPPAPITEASFVEQCASAVRAPDSRSELNFDDDAPRTRRGMNGGAHYQTKHDTKKLLERPAALADFLLDPSLLPKKPPPTRTA